MLIIAKPARDYPWLQQHKSEVASTRRVAKLLEVALSFAREGRVGSAIGTTFVLGDGKDLAPYLSRLVLHPLKERSQDTRSIHKPECIEPIRELSAMDGAFVVKRRGVMDSACRHLNAPVGAGQLSPGLGTRHPSALAVTTVTGATAVEFLRDCVDLRRRPDCPRARASQCPVVGRLEPSESY